MTTENMEVLPIEKPSSGTLSHVNTRVKSNFSSNIHALKNGSMPKTTASMNGKDRRIYNVPIVYDVSIARQIRITKYTIYLLF